MKKNKSIIIILGIILAILIALGITGIVFLTTDIFKSNKEIFFKYLIEENEIINFSKNKTQEKNEVSYTKVGSIDFIYENNNNNFTLLESDQVGKEIQESIKNLRAFEDITGSIKSSVDNENKNSLYQIQLQKNEKDIFNLDLVRNEDKYAFKSKGIANKYIGIENNNLKEFFEKMGVEDTSIIPDKIELTKNLQTILDINEDEKEHIFRTYKNIIYNSINEENITKSERPKNYVNGQENITNIYILTLSKTDIINITNNILNTLKQDSITLNMLVNKIKDINPESEYANLAKLSELIDLYIDKLNKIEKSDIEFLKIEEYIEKNSVKKIVVTFDSTKEIIFENYKKDEKDILEITQRNFTEESIDIKYNSLPVQKIRIIKEEDYKTYQLVLFNIKDIYKAMLDQMNTQNDNSIVENEADFEEDDIEEENEENVETINGVNEKYDIQEIQKLYDKYNMAEEEIGEISLNIKVKENSDNKNDITIYLSAYSTKAGINIKTEKNYNVDVEDIVKLDKNNSAIINNYSKETIDKLVTLLIDKYSKKITNALEI